MGLAETSRVIGAAAVIMVCVFASSAMHGEWVSEMFGLGLAAAVAVDAFLLRMVLVPVIMHLIGKANWWLPRRIDRTLPRLSLEAADGPDNGAVLSDPVLVNGSLSSSHISSTPKIQ
ncbi:hypothetical protein KQY30_33455 [Streptomyces sp. GMY02]|nr:hypothetical protein KQY30_33455 [Streptomyces sp. GMY02]